MSVLPIRRFDDKILTSSTRLVREDEFEEVNTILKQMAETMYSSQGVGLAGPQVGDQRSICVVDKSYVTGQRYGSEYIAMINPVITWVSEETEEAEEGCLSFPGFAQKVVSPIAIEVFYISSDGEKQLEKFDGWLARIARHEIDHLKGITLLKRASDFKRSRYLKKIRKMRKQYGQMRGM